MIVSWKVRFNRKIGEAIYLSALKDVVAQTPASVRPGVALSLFSGLILAAPVLCGAIGLWLIAFDFPNLVTLVLGGTFLATAWFIRPRRAQMPKDVLDRNDLPQTFAFLDALADYVQAPRVDCVDLFNDFNAYAAVVDQKTVVGIGSLMWLAADRPQRQALLAHELGHLVNKDVEKSTLGYRAHHVLEGLLELTEPEYMYDPHSGAIERRSEGILADLLVGAFRLAVEILSSGLQMLRFGDSQKAEYKADAVSVDGAGKEAVLRLMDMLVLIEASEKARDVILPRKDERGLPFLHRLTATINELPKVQVDKAIAEHDAALLSLDGTHPPTRYRKSFVAQLPTDGGGMPLDQVNWDAVDTEMRDKFAALGDALIETHKVH